MGQDLSQPSLQLQRVTSSKHSHNLSGTKMRSIPEQKLLIVITDSQELKIEVIDDTLTCGWLLSETIRLYDGCKNIISLKTSKNLEALDYWLIHFERSLQPFKNKETLVAVFQEPAPAEIGPLSFAPVK